MRLLVIRTSAMGDVALTTPVLKRMRELYQEVEITMVTRKVFSPFFSSIEGLNLYFPDFNARHRGIAGLVRLYLDLRKQGEFEYLLDLHDVLRTKLLRLLLRITGVKIRVIDKGRKEKKALVKGVAKESLKHTVVRYMKVFEEAGFKLDPRPGPWIIPSKEALLRAENISGIKPGLNIGVAPYARHELKVWPEQNMIGLLKLIAYRSDAKFWLFGGADEAGKLASFQKKVPGSELIAGRLKLDEELALMSKLNFMISMDSSNMHMAALTGTKVISIWGATDPLTGFGAWMQPEENSIRIPVDQLTCRPCTVYGKGECRRGDHACMIWLTPGLVYDKIRSTGLL